MPAILGRLQRVQQALQRGEPPPSEDKDRHVEPPRTRSKLGKGANGLNDGCGLLLFLLIAFAEGGVRSLRRHQVVVAIVRVEEGLLHRASLLVPPEQEEQ